ncbi:MAG: 50S ribosomal protein L6, partial [Verrucomicrobiota bacterium]|nr:50S ribosomal protein L6 [Verrucomicrobiota bacterium]
MSRIGKVPVAIPSGVEVSMEGRTLRVKGPKGDLSKDFSPLAEIKISDDQVVVSPVGE